jgi:hypothetical protein
MVARRDSGREALWRLSWPLGNLAAPRHSAMCGPRGLPPESTKHPPPKTLSPCPTPDRGHPGMLDAARRADAARGNLPDPCTRPGLDIPSATSALVVAGAQRPAPRDDRTLPVRRRLVAAAAWTRDPQARGCPPSDTGLAIYGHSAR